MGYYQDEMRLSGGAGAGLELGEFGVGVDKLVGSGSGSGRFGSSSFGRVRKRESKSAR